MQRVKPKNRLIKFETIEHLLMEVKKIKTISEHALADDNIIHRHGVWEVQAISKSLVTLLERLQ